MSLGETEEIVNGFLSQSLEAKQWTHEAHLRVALWHAIRFTPEESLTKLRYGIKRFNESIDVANTNISGYHETITYFYTKIVAHFLTTQDLTRPIDEIAEDLIAAIGHKDVYAEFYSKERFLSNEGRDDILEPDLKALPDSRSFYDDCI